MLHLQKRSANPNATPTVAHHVIMGRFSQRKTPDRMAIPLLLMTTTKAGRAFIPTRLGGLRLTAMTTISPPQPKTRLASDLRKEPHAPHNTSLALLATPSFAGGPIVTEEPPIADVRPQDVTAASGLCP